MSHAQKTASSHKPLRPFKPSIIVSIKNSQNLYSLATKNKWFSEFRQSSLYYGIIFDLYPTFFSLPDEFNLSKDLNWSGRLIDYVYDSILKNRPLQVYYYQQKRLASPWGVNISGLTSAESKLVDQLIKLFKVGDDKDITTANGESGKVSLIEIKAQKWAIKKDGSCLTLGKDPKVVLSLSSNCKPPKFDSDMDVEFNLSMLFPSLMMIRGKVVGLNETMKAAFQWNSIENRFDLAPVSMTVGKDNIFVARKITNDFLKVIPSDSHFFVIGNIRIWNGNMSMDNVKAFLSSQKRPKDFKKQAAAVLVQLPVKKDDILISENALIIESSTLNQEQLDGVAKVFESSFGEVFLRPVCSKALVVSRSKEVLQKIQNVCDRKVPSILDRTDLKMTELSTQESSLSFFADAGKWASGMIESGYLIKSKEKKMTSALPEELIKSQKILEQLPKYLVKGTAKEQNLILK